MEVFMTETKQIIASNLSVAAALIQVANAEKGKSTTSDGSSEALNIYRSILSRLEKEGV